MSQYRIDKAAVLSSYSCVNEGDFMMHACVQVVVVVQNISYGPWSSSYIHICIDAVLVIYIVVFLHVQLTPARSAHMHAH